MTGSIMAGALAFLASLALGIAADVRAETAVERALLASLLAGFAAELTRRNLRELWGQAAERSQGASSNRAGARESTKGHSAEANQ